MKFWPPNSGLPQMHGGPFAFMTNLHRNLLKEFLYYGVKLPGIFFLMVSGIMVDFIIQSPFIVICALEHLIHKRAR
jgi:hypothetical protein